jgi:hypothetical protein
MFHHIALIPMSNLLLFFVADINAAVQRSCRDTEIVNTRVSLTSNPQPKLDCMAAAVSTN